VKLNLTTNGTFPKLGASEWAKKIVPVTSDVKISWNGASKKTHEKIMLGSNWEKALSNIKTFISIRDEHARQGGNRCRVTFQMTFLESNINELPDIVRLAIQLGVDRLKGHHLWAHFGEIKDESMRRDMNAIRRWNAAVQVAHQIVMEHPLSNGRSLLLENIYPLDEEYKDDIAPGGQCPFLGKGVGKCRRSV
jgi:MoaA/NifB/PqqE/SkfB family radical SAM enzyme